MRRARGAAMVLLAASAFAVGASCRGVVSPETVDLASELCTLIDDCQSLGWDCAAETQSWIGQILADGRDPNETLLLLDQARDCLESCGAARGCRDELPICLQDGESGCREDADCCGSTAGAGVCLDAICCIPSGAGCSADSYCCGDVSGGSPCDEDLHCGDVVCAAVDEDCVANFDCCSKRCGPEGTCISNVCALPFDACKVDGDCCDTFVAGALVPVPCEGASATTTGTCVPPEGCVGCDPLDVTNCCTELEGQFCYVVGDELTQCAPANCPPAGAECGSDSDCCSDLGLVCDGGAIPHCATCRSPGSPCQPGEVESCCEPLVCRPELGVCALLP